jgi:hypothetical protein
VKYVPANLTLVKENWESEDECEMLRVTVGHETLTIRLWGRDDMQNLKNAGVPMEDSNV